MKGWTSEDIERIKAKKSKPVKIVAPPTKKLKKVPVGLQHIVNVLTALNINFVYEHRFDAVRRFRFDIAMIEHFVSIEFEGIIATKSRHTNIVGYSVDCCKYNLAAINGWKVLRYTALNYKEFDSDIKKIIESSSNIATND